MFASYHQDRLHFSNMVQEYSFSVELNAESIWIMYICIGMDYSPGLNLNKQSKFENKIPIKTEKNG